MMGDTSVVAFVNGGCADGTGTGTRGGHEAGPTALNARGSRIGSAGLVLHGFLGILLTDGWENWYIVVDGTGSGSSSSGSRIPPGRKKESISAASSSSTLSVESAMRSGSSDISP